MAGAGTLRRRPICPPRPCRRGARSGRRAKPVPSTDLKALADADEAAKREAAQ
jgi:hypothetical protein